VKATANEDFAFNRIETQIAILVCRIADEQGRNSSAAKLGHFLFATLRIGQMAIDWAAKDAQVSQARSLTVKDLIGRSPSRVTAKGAPVAYVNGGSVSKLPRGKSERGGVKHRT